MIEKLKERIAFRRRRRVEKKLRKYIVEYMHYVIDNEELLTKGELKRIDDIASYCYIDIHRIAYCIDRQLKKRFGSESTLKWRIEMSNDARNKIKNMLLNK